AAAPKQIPPLPQIPNLVMSDASSSQSISIINGQSSSAYSLTFSLTPTQPGEFTIPALQADVGGQILQSEPLKLKAVKTAPTEPGKGEDPPAFIKIFLPKEEVFVGEVLTVEFQV